MFDLSFISALPYYYLFLTVLIITLGLTWWMTNSRMGFYLRAIKDSERAARSLGALFFTRYGEIIERSLVHQGLKHYFLVHFPQEPGALRRFLDEVLGPDDDITLFEYVKRNNRETGAALVGVQLGEPAGLAGLMDRMSHSRLNCERLEPGTPAYDYLT